MSLFPAYSGEKTDPTSSTDLNIQGSEWLSNESFQVKDLEAFSTTSENKRFDDLNVEPIVKHRKVKTKKTKNERQNLNHGKAIQFTGKEDYYVDKVATKSYLTVDTLHRPARPKYQHKFFKVLGGYGYGRAENNFKRYYKEKLHPIEVQSDSKLNPVENEVEFVIKTKEFNEYLVDYPNDITKWVEFVEHQNVVGVILKLSKTQLADKKCDILERALKENIKNKELVTKYLEIITNVFPADEVSKRIEKFLARDSANDILWNALINASQGSMARCSVPEVLKLYEKCMQTLYNKQGNQHILLELFYKSALFLRQCGLNEQFFALIKFALELNLTSDKLVLFEPTESDQNTLIEYEEVILKSGLPMNEIWLRIEKLRQNFNFLPCPENFSCSDPQRIIYTEDISNFIYPTGECKYLALTMPILKLLKIPFFELCEGDQLYVDEAEFDDIEKLLSIMLQNSVGNPAKYDRFNKVMLEFIKEFNVGPSYIANQIGHELYYEVIVKLLLKLYELADDPMYILLWIKFEHLILKINHENSNVNYSRLKVKIKSFLKVNQEFRNNINFFTLYTHVIYENEGFANYEDIVNKMLMNYHYRDGYDDDITNFIFSYIEVLFIENLNKIYNDRILKILIMMLLDIKCINNLYDDIDSFQLTDSRKLLALNKVETKFKANMNCALVFQYKMYLNILIKNRIENFDLILENMDCLEMRVYEIFFKSIELIENNYNSQNYLVLLKCGVNKYPKNLILLRYLVLIENKLLYKIKNVLDDSNKNSIFLIFLIVMFNMNSKYAAVDGDEQEHLNSIIKNRIKNLLKFYLNDNAETNKMKKNSILWRLYIKFIYNCEENLSQLKTILYKSLDECPWVKGLYMDGAVYVPQELSQLQDLIIEKQLRIYALPDELEILRDEKIS